jgi:hypothetical protein
LTSDKATPALISHLESRLGRIKSGWSGTPDGRPVPFSVVYLQQGQFDGVTSYATIGLSNHPLVAKGSGKAIHAELVLCVRSEVPEGNPYAAALQQIGLAMIRNDRPLLRGDTVPMNLGPDHTMDGFYVTAPVYFDDDFAVAPLEDGRRAVIVWLVPVGKRELDFIDVNGWSKFEEKLIEVDPDLFDMRRAEIV